MSENDTERDEGAAPEGAETGAEHAELDAEGNGVEEEVDPLTALAAERDKLKDQLLRTAADFDNFRKRSRKDIELAERKAREAVLRQVLPVIDDLERAGAAVATATEIDGIRQGVEMVLKQFEDVAQRIGLERVKSVGERFDPARHDAIQQQETSDVEPGTVIHEVVPGYRFEDKLLRAAMVVVARKPSGD